MNSERTIPAQLKEQVLDKRETAHLLKISTETLDRLHRQGRGPERCYVGHQVRYLLSQVVSWLEETSRAGGPSRPVPRDPYRRPDGSRDYDAEMRDYEAAEKTAEESRRASRQT